MAIAVNGLPSPGSSHLEVNFRRMLMQCSNRAQHPGESRSSDWRGDPKFHFIVDSLQEKLYELENGAADRPSSDVLQLYKACVKSIVDELRQPQLPAYCFKASSRGTPAPASSTTSPAPLLASAAEAEGSTNQGTAADETLLRNSRVQLAAARDAGSLSTSTTAATSTKPPAVNIGPPQPAALGLSAPSAASAAAASADGGAPSFTLSQSAQDKLQTQQRLQDDLTDELLDMGQELKASTLAMQNAIRFRGKLLDDTEVHLEHSAANAHSIANKAKQQYKQSRLNLCQTLLLLLIVALIFCGMVVWIKVTSMVGLKGR